MIWNSTEPSQVRKFGLAAFLFSACLCGLGLWRGRLLPTLIFGFLGVLGISFVLLPGPMGPVYTAWIRIARWLARLSTGLALALVYYVVITPFALMKRLSGGPPLPLRPDKGTASYWVSREEPSQPRERFWKRY